MEYILRVEDKIKEKTAKMFLLFLLDYDGTLTTMAERPDKVILSLRTRKILKQISAFPSRYKLAVISGRALKDIKRQIGLEGIIYAGNHGLEIQGPDIAFTARVSTRTKADIKHIGDALKNKLSEIRGAFVEDKGLTLSVHYRLVSKDKIALMKNIVENILKFYLESGKIKVNMGKQVIDVRPPLKWDKGKAALWLLKREQLIHRRQFVLPVYIGDDITDEDAFAALKGRGLTIFVGRPQNTSAQYFLKDTTEVLTFLQKIIYN